MEYKVKVENFEGPMDLLLFFIQRDKLNIYDIPIAHITKNFLDYIKMIDTLNIDLYNDAQVIDLQRKVFGDTLQINYFSLTFCSKNNIIFKSR